MSDGNLEKLMNAHLDGIGRELRDIKDQQRTGFSEIRNQMIMRDAKTEAEIKEVHSRVESVDKRVDSVERTMNRWGGAFALVLLVVGLGVPVLIWGLNLVVR